MMRNAEHATANAMAKQEMNPPEMNPPEMNPPAMNPVYRRRLWKHRVGISLSVAAMAIGIFFLMWILFTLVIKGAGAWGPALFTQTTPAPGSEGGGLINAIFGSLLMVGVATLVSTPIGVLAGIYLAEYGERSLLAKVTRFVTDIMLSAPSIVTGLFVYAIYVANAKHFSGWAGSFAIALIAVPVIVRTTDNMLNLVPTSLREAAFALGAPRWKVATMIRLRAVKAGVMTGMLLAVARISGETAPLLFTALNNQFFSSDMNAPMANLPVVIYQFAMSPYENWRALAWGGALLLTCSVLALNILSRTLFTQKVRGHS
jgi:phosphate transport system permease protein